MGSIVLVLAIAAVGVGTARQAAAQLEDPRKLLELIKKKKDAGKKNAPRLFPGKKDGGKTAVAPKGTPSRAFTGRENDPRGRTNAGLPNGPDGKGTPKAGFGNRFERSNTATGSTNTNAGLGKGANPKSTLGNAVDGKGPVGGRNLLGKAGAPKGTNFGGTNFRGTNFRAAIRGPLRGATPVERFRFRADHHREILNVRRLLPVRPLPGERGFTGVPPVGETRFVSTEMVFRAGPNVSRQALDDAARRLGLTVIGSQNSGVAGGTIYHFRVAQGRPVTDVVRSLEAENIGVASPNYVYQLNQDQQQPEQEPDLAASGNSGGNSEQYVVSKLQLDEVHKVATGKNVLIGVIDSAVDFSHPDISGAIADRFNAVGKQESPHTHGTGMVGAIAAHQRLIGIAPNARILAVQAFSTTMQQTPQATTQQILAGIDWAISKGARIINMSFAGPYDPLLQVAMKNAAAKGVVLIAAAGNLGPKSPPLFPAADPNVIAVTATDENDKLFSGSVRGPQIAVAAPGVDVMVPAPADSYQLTTGTSVAAAHVSGVAALLIERYPNVDAATVLEVLTATAKKLGTKDHDNDFGWGLIDPEAALAELDSRMADGRVASATRPAAPKQATAPKASPKQAAQKTSTTPRLGPASAQ